LNTKLIDKVKELQKLLEVRKNKASAFFENIVSELGFPELKSGAKEKLRTCYSITQYADFNSKEEKLRKEILRML